LAEHAISHFARELLVYFRKDYMPATVEGIQLSLEKLLSCRREGGCGASDYHAFEWVRDQWYQRMSVGTEELMGQYLDGAKNDFIRLLCVETPADLLAEVVCHATKGDICAPEDMTTEFRETSCVTGVTGTFEQD
jgi:hypothetical protein